MFISSSASKLAVETMLMPRPFRLVAKASSSALPVNFGKAHTRSAISPIVAIGDSE